MDLFQAHVILIFLKLRCNGFDACKYVLSAALPSLFKLGQWKERATQFASAAAKSGDPFMIAPLLAIRNSEVVQNKKTWSVVVAAILREGEKK